MYESNGVGWILFAIVCLIIAAIAFQVVIISLAVFGTLGVIRYSYEGKYIRAVLCACLALFIVNLEYQVDWGGFRGCREHGCSGWHYETSTHQWEMD